MTATHDPKHLQCMEVWGGNAPIDTSVILPGLDAWVYSRPYAGDAEGGDVHYVSSCAAGAISRLFVADVSGHGAAVSDTARQLRNLMRRHVNHHQQTGFVRAMNRQFAALGRIGMFATAVVATYEGPLRRLLLTNAGHPPPLLYKVCDQRWSKLEKDARRASAAEGAGITDLPLGIEDVSDYEQFNVPLDTGDMILCYTDALVEARRPGTGQMLGANGLACLIGDLDISAPARIIPDLMAAVTAGGWEIGDDLTLLLFRTNGTRPSIPLPDRLLAPFRLIRELSRSCFDRR